MVVAGVKGGKRTRTSNRNKNEYEEEKIYHFSLPPLSFPSPLDPLVLCPQEEKSQEDG